MRISSLHTYPIKGSHRIDHREAGVEPWGLAGDRRWMVVDPDGVGITQRQTPLLSQIQVTPAAGGLLVRAPGRADLLVDEPVDGPKEFVRVFKNKQPVPARLAADRGWFSEFLERPARLIWQADPTGRPVEDHREPGDSVSMADGFPMLMTNEASLSALNDWLAEGGDDPVPMTRFRPNVVISGAQPWAEDDMIGRRLLLGAVPVRVAKSCDRCVVTTIDQETGMRTGQPLKILGRHRRFPGGLLFGVNVTPDVTPGTQAVLRVGDEVRHQP